jgi:hypothetical protein
MATVTGDQYFVRCFTAYAILPIREVTVHERRIDRYFVFSVLKTLQRPVCQAKTPGCVIVRCPVRDPVWVLRYGEEVRFQLAERHLLVDRKTVANHMQV